MYLIIYKRKNKLYFNTGKKLTETIYITNERMERVKLGYKNKIESFRMNDWFDFKNAMPKLKKYSLRMFIVENRYSDKTQIKFYAQLMNNGFIDIGLKEFEEVNEVPEGECGTKLVEIFDKSDISVAEKEFRFNADELVLEGFGMYGYKWTLNWLFDFVN